MNLEKNCKNGANVKILTLQNVHSRKKKEKIKIQKLKNSFLIFHFFLYICNNSIHNTVQLTQPSAAAIEPQRQNVVNS